MVLVSGPERGTWFCALGGFLRSLSAVRLAGDMKYSCCESIHIVKMVIMLILQNVAEFGLLDSVTCNTLQHAGNSQSRQDF